MAQSDTVSPETSDNSSTINIAVISACSLIVIIVLFWAFVIWGRKNKVHHKYGVKDEYPLTKLSATDASPGPAVNYSFGNSGKKDFKTLSNVTSFADKPRISLAEEKQSEKLEVPSGKFQANLPLPPGRVSISAPKPVPLVTETENPAPQVPASVTKDTEPATPVSGTPPPPSPKKHVAPPPPPKINLPPPPNPPKLGTGPKPPPGKVGFSANKGAGESDSQKAKLKPFFWDKVLANPEHSMVWNEIKSGSFQFNEEMMEDLFGYTSNNHKTENSSKKNQAAKEALQFTQIIDPKKSHNLSILLKAVNVTTQEVCDAIQEGNELPAELIETLLKMAPTSQEELKLRLYDEDISKLGPADRFVKTLIEIPFAYQRLEALLFMCSLQNEFGSLKESFKVLEVACTELKNSRLFLKLLEAVLKLGNRMNDGTFRGGAQAFKLDTLLKLSDVKGVDGKTTLLHFVVLEIIKSEGLRAARKLKDSSSMSDKKVEDMLKDSVQETPEHLRSLGLEVVSNLSNELANVKKAAAIDGDMLTNTVTKLGFSLKHNKDFLYNEMSSEEAECQFRSTLESFVRQTEFDIMWLLEEENRIGTLVKSTAEYFHGTPGKDEGMRLFIIVRDFLVMVDKVCQEVKKSGENPVKMFPKEA
ncbi:formin-like protein 5 [Daucus carota subsp. sativus]|uniref:formin-like protein 5 n=1 Tax=Daucus carota subsp. sativus TaxID=79200 RepID=UPI0007B17B3F|nr:PREDICTED: formin-like protein 5 [Daucus carota subsp. sativus]